MYLLDGDLSRIGAVALEQEAEWQEDGLAVARLGVLAEAGSGCGALNSGHLADTFRAEFAALLQHVVGDQSGPRELPRGIGENPEGGFKVTAQMRWFRRCLRRGIKGVRVTLGRILHNARS